MKAVVIVAVGWPRELVSVMTVLSTVAPPVNTERVESPYSPAMVVVVGDMEPGAAVITVRFVVSRLL